MKKIVEFKSQKKQPDWEKIRQKCKNDFNSYVEKKEQEEQIRFRNIDTRERM